MLELAEKAPLLFKDIVRDLLPPANGSMNLIATMRLDSFSWADQTTPWPPAPILSSNS